jgi:hypothetical protein
MTSESTPGTADVALQSAFGNEMHRIYQRALAEAGYKATRFLHMLHEHGGLQTARMLLHASTFRKATRRFGNADVSTSPLKR